MVKNWIKLYIAMYLNIAKLVTNAHRPSKIRCKTHEIFPIEDVKGAATLASACERETPTWAAFKAFQTRTSWVRLMFDIRKLS